FLFIICVIAGLAQRSLFPYTTLFRSRIKDKKGMRPNSGPENNKAVVHLYWKDDRAEIFLDTSGETLAKHGYRKIPGKAPMLEALDRKSTRLNSSHVKISYAVFCLKKQ